MQNGAFFKKSKNITGFGFIHKARRQVSHVGT